MSEAAQKLDRAKFKTELCKNWIELRVCRYGSKCQFAHGHHELMSKEPQNDKYKSKQCKQFFTKGFCPYGNRCLFKHEQREIGELRTYFYTYKLEALKYGQGMNMDSKSETYEK